ncbi:MAG: winged helix-turn-helix transcriptional regulator, partial [Alphaproteobacteria bacterium]|nr:winged helix-turn-helix transcriptional regulator [Alphaproteobacteria bacterium]
MTTRIANTPLLSLALDRSTMVPLQMQIYDQIRDAILSGRLAPGTGLPATRTLATELGLSRNTILGAFDRLLAEGYVEGKPGSGTHVSNILPDDLLSTRGRTASQSRSSAPAGKTSQLSKMLTKGHYRRRHSAAG